jgi:uncharacterized membrane protein
MYDGFLFWEWAAMFVRWLHVITAIAWIGSSFYFIALDLGLKKSPDLPKGAHGEEWQVHGGGFYHIQKYLVAPERLPEHLTWFKWESYATWLSGFALLAVVYYLGAELYLIDPNVLDLAIWQAIAISIASLAIGWAIYDGLCKLFVNVNQNALMVALFAVLVAAAWFYTQVFSGRAAMIHLGAFTATLMSANVFMIIIPNQKIVVADLKAGRTPDPKYGKIAKQRSTHNNYLTLPVIFLMLSNHYPLVFASEWNWVIASLIFLMGVTIRHWFNERHAGRESPYWTWLATTVLLILVCYLMALPLRQPAQNAALSTSAVRFAQAEGFEDVVTIVQGRCAMCHATNPGWESLRWPPKGVVLETEQQIATEALRIAIQSGFTHAMPPANVSLMEQQEREKIIAWVRAAEGAP